MTLIIEETEEDVIKRMDDLCEENLGISFSETIERLKIWDDPSKSLIDELDGTYLEVQIKLALHLLGDDETKQELLEAKDKVFKKEGSCLYSYKFPVGDWSGDGHRVHDTFYVQGKKPVHDVREAHFKCKKILGFNIGDICGKYEEKEMNKNIKNTLLKREIVKDNLFSEFESEPSLSICKIWVLVLNYIDPELRLKIVDNNTPSISFYGSDDKGRYFDAPGYGLWD